MQKFKEERYIFQRFNEKTKQWTFQVQIRVPKKEPIVKTFSERKYGSARRAYDTAVNFRNQTMFEIDKGLYTHKVDVMLVDVLYESFELFPIRESTKKKDILLFNKYIGRYNNLVQKINRTIVIESLNKMIRDSSNDTIQRVLSVWRKLAKTALSKEYINVDFTSGIVAPKSQRIEKVKKKVITDRDTVDKVLEAINKKFDKKEAKQVCMAIELMWYTGLRPAECFALDKEDVKNGIVNVYKELGSDIADNSIDIDRDNLNIVRRCKTEASIRQVPMPQKLQELLDSYDVEGDILFPNKYGNYFNLEYIGARIRNLGIPFNLYQLRHTVSTKLITNNVDSRTIIEILGHENIDMSIYYARSNEDLKKEALDLI